MTKATFGFAATPSPLVTVTPVPAVIVRAVTAPAAVRTMMPFAARPEIAVRIADPAWKAAAVNRAVIACATLSGVIALVSIAPASASACVATGTVMVRLAARLPPPVARPAVLMAIVLDAHRRACSASEGRRRYQAVQDSVLTVYSRRQLWVLKSTSFVNE